MLLARYSGHRQSYISCRKRSSSSTSLSKLAYHTAKQQTLKPLTDFDENSTKEGEPIADEGVPAFLTTVPITKRQHHTDAKFPKLPQLGASVDENWLKLFRDKCDACCVMCDFSDLESDVSAKTLKTNTLKELVEVLNQNNISSFDEETNQSLFNMITVNLTRPIPPIEKKYLVYDDEPLIIEINWNHLQHVYAIIKAYYTVVRQSDFYHQLRKIMNTLLVSADPNEREEILNFYKEYVKMYPDQMDSLLTEFSYKLIEYKDTRPISLPFPVTPILKFIAEAIKNSDSITDHIDEIFKKAVVPLISCQHIVTVYPQLMAVIDAMTEKDPGIPKQVLRIALHHWPETCPSKQISYFFLLNFLIQKLSAEDFEQMCQPIFRLYTRCALSSQHAKVIETSFKIWSDVKILQMIMDNTKAIFPIAYPTYQRIMKEHWKSATQDAALNAIKSMHDLDPFMFDELAQAQKKGQSIQADNDFDSQIHKSWAQIARSAAKRDKSVNLARVLAEIQVNFSRPPETQQQSDKRKNFSPGPSNPKIIAPKTGAPIRF